MSAFAIELPKMVITKDLSNRVVGDMSLATGSVPSLNKNIPFAFYGYGVVGVVGDEVSVKKTDCLKG